MSIFGKWFKASTPPPLDDAVLGHIQFQPSHGIDMWCHIPSSDGDHMIIVIAPVSGPSDRQRQFYAGLRTELATRTAECKAFIANQDGAPTNLQYLRLYSVEVGSEAEINAGEYVLELADSEANEIHRVEFKSGRPSAYGVDD